MPYYLDHAEQKDSYRLKSGCYQDESKSAKPKVIAYRDANQGGNRRQNREKNKNLNGSDHPHASPLG